MASKQLSIHTSSPQPLPWAVFQHHAELVGLIGHNGNSGKVKKGGGKQIKDAAGSIATACLSARSP